MFDIPEYKLSLSLKSQPQVPKSQTLRGRGEFGLLAVTKILWANNFNLPINFEKGDRSLFQVVVKYYTSKVVLYFSIFQTVRLRSLFSLSECK